MLVRALVVFCFSIISGKVLALNIVVTIPPLASMVSPLLSEDDTLSVLLTPGQTPHGFQLKPSSMMAIENADIILAIGSEVDNWVKKAISKVPEKQLVMAKLPGLVKLQLRSHADWQIKLIDDEQLSKNHHHDMDDKQETLLNHHHNELKMDPHLWLSPDNAILFVRAFGEKYLQHTTASAKGNSGLSMAFNDKVIHFLAKINETDLKIKQQLKPVSGKAYVVLHDAFQYFEAHYHLNGVGAIQVSPELQPSLNKMIRMQKTIKTRGVTCVFKEPQFPAKQVNYLVRGMDVRVGNLDPLGGRNENESYDVFIQTLANQFSECLMVPQKKP